MKKIILSIVAIGMFVAPSLAQEKAIVEDGFGAHWFIQAQAGGSYTISEDRKHASFGDLLTPHYAVSFGKFFSPLTAMRFQAAGWESKNYVELGENSGTYGIKYIQANLDGFLNLTNLFLSFREDRPFNFYAFAGIGYVHTFKKDCDCWDLSRTNSIIPRIGLQGDFRLSDNVSLNIEVAGNLMSDNFNGRVQGKKYDGTINALGGITYRFGRGDFEKVDVMTPEQLAALNQQINAQRGQLDDKDRMIADLRDQLSNVPTPTIIRESEKEIQVVLNAVVVFRINSAKIENNQLINIYNAARYLNENPDVNVVIAGYADKETGNPTINQRLSQQRADAVANTLIEKYKISPDRIIKHAEGDKVQPFPTPEWNRVVVFTVK